MRILLLSLVALSCMAAAVPAQAERRVFIILGRTDSGAVDGCLASGNACGAAAADAYCRSHRFVAAISFHKVDRADITGVIPAGPAGCGRDACGSVVAIVCSR